jgi:hypothetical protein
MIWEFLARIEVGWQITFTWLYFFIMYNLWSVDFSWWHRKQTRFCSMQIQPLNRTTSSRFFIENIHMLQTHEQKWTIIPYHIIIHHPASKFKKIWILLKIVFLKNIILADFYPGWWFGTFFIFPYIGKNNPNWLSYFSEGLKPPSEEGYDI